MKTPNFISDGHNYHIDGIPWWKAKIPPRLHFCKPQTWGIPSTLPYHIYRCRCGAVKINSGPWMDKNSRKRGK